MAAKRLDLGIFAGFPEFRRVNRARSEYSHNWLLIAWAGPPQGLAPGAIAPVMQKTVPNSAVRDPLAADEFVRLYTVASRRIYTYILTLLPDRTDAEDVFQEVSTVLWEKFREFTPGTQFGAWACRIAYFKAIKFRSLKSVRTRMFSEQALENISAELEAMDDSLDVEYRLLAECFAGLPPEEKSLIEQRYRANGSPREIASATGVPIRRIYKSLDRIRKALLTCVTRKLAEGGQLAEGNAT